MADFLDEVADYLQTQGVGTVASAINTGDIFIEDIPPDPTNVIVILGATGVSIPGGSRQIGTLNFPRFQVYVRNTSYTTASAKLKAVRDALHAKYGVILPNWRILSCHADQEGGPVGKDDSGRFEFSINFTTEVNAEAA